VSARDGHGHRPTFQIAVVLAIPAAGANSDGCGTVRQAQCPGQASSAQTPSRVATKWPKAAFFFMPSLVSGPDWAQLSSAQSRAEEEMQEKSEEEEEHPSMEQQQYSQLRLMATTTIST